MDKKNNKKTHASLGFGIFLIIIQVIAFRGAYIDNYHPPFFEGVGFCIPGIFGILIIIENIKNERKNKK